MPRKKRRMITDGSLGGDLKEFFGNNVCYKGKDG
jgi:hypothetical protein